MDLVKQDWRGELEVWQNRQRQGCDVCKTNPPTECFVGFVGSVLWVCGPCVEKLQDWMK